MLQKIKLTFHNEGLRSYIGLDLCCNCPRQDKKGCCGWYSPVWYPVDLGFVKKNDASILDYVLKLDHLTFLDNSITINNLPESESYQCRLHQKDGGCIIPQHLRESVCRQFICIGVNWQSENNLQHWVRFFDLLSDYEISINNRISEQLQSMGLTLRDPQKREIYLKELLPIYEKEINNPPAFFKEFPNIEEVTIEREIDKFGTEWVL